MKLQQAFIETPLGPMVALATSDALCALEFTTNRSLPRSRTAARPSPRASSEPALPTRLAARLQRWFAPYEIERRSNAVIVRTREWLDEYFSGRGAAADAIPLELRGAPFERRVWGELRKIPAGATSSYGAIARQLGSAGAPRAVGLANGANPIAIIVPCHRVIGSNGTLTGYGGGLDRKQWLLDHERQWAAQRSLTLAP
jgi:O-6-methylguanine DNA methyltransferase